MPKYSDICAAARAGDLAAVQDMVQADPQTVFTTDKYGFNALHETLVADNCGNVNFELVRFLVHAGCPINQISKGSHPRSPLWIAAEFCPDTEIVQFLIDNGADLATLESDGRHVVDCIDNLQEQKAVQHLLGTLTGHPLPEPPPPPKYPEQRTDTATWRKTTAAIKKPLPNWNAQASSPYPTQATLSVSVLPNASTSWNGSPTAAVLRVTASTPSPIKTGQGNSVVYT